MEPTDLVVPPEASSLGDAIRWLRIQRRATLRELAEAIGVSAPFLSDVEHGRRNPNDAMVARLATALGTDAYALGLRRGLIDRAMIDEIAKDPDLVRWLRHELATQGPKPWRIG